MAFESTALRLLVCGHLFPETSAVIASEGFADVFAASYVSDCGHPRRPESLDALLAALHSGASDTVLISGGCLPANKGGPVALPQNRRIYRVENCFTLLVDGWKLDELFRDGAYVLTPGWLSGWQSQLAQWGFNQETARSFFAESSTCLALLDTGVDDRSVSALTEFGSYIDKPFRVIPVGLEHYRAQLVNLVQQWRLERKGNDLRKASETAARTKADLAMLLDLMADLTHMDSEAETIEKIFDLFEMFFAPRKLLYASVSAGRVTECRARPSTSRGLEECQDLLDAGWDRSSVREGVLRLRISFRDELLGLLELESVAFPEYREAYRNLVPSLAQICGLGVANARMYQEIKQLATIDPLTGLMNRRHFLSLASAEFARVLRYDRPLSVIMLDIDFFKKVNDAHGHQAGDKVLISFARRLREELRAADICARYGGEEFIVLMPETRSDIAMTAAERIRLRVADMSVPYEGLDLKITVSMGVAVWDSTCPDLDTLIGRSDEALYAAKNSGRDRVCAWTGELTALNGHYSMASKSS